LSCYIDPNGALSWDALLPYVLPYTRGVPDEIAAQAIRASAIEFCRWSGYLHDVAKYDLQANVHHYPLETLCDYNIVRVFRVTVRGVWNYWPVVEKPLFQCGCFVFFMESPTCLRLQRPPQLDEPQALEVEVVVAPKQDSCTLDNDLYEYWADGISAGAVDRILSMPNTDWYNPSEAKRFGLKFKNEKARARAERDRQFASSSMMVAPRWA
jgi:hypothetical protein